MTGRRRRSLEPLPFAHFLGGIEITSDWARAAGLSITSARKQHSPGPAKDRRGSVQLLEPFFDGCEPPPGRDRNNTLDGLFESGELDEVLRVADDLVACFEASGDARHVEGVRGAQVRVWALRGPGPHVVDVCDRLESASRGTEDSWGGFDTVGPAALARAALGQAEAAATLLAELAAGPGTDPGNPNFTAYLPSMVRTALMIGERDLADRSADGFEPTNPYAEHALVAVNAALAESGGELETAAKGYADAADRWEWFGVVPEQAFALLGQGRCLLGLSRPTEAATVLNHALEIFRRLQAAPALAETGALLQQAATLSS